MDELEKTLTREKTKSTADNGVDKAYTIAEPFVALITGISAKIVYDCAKDSNISAGVTAIAFFVALAFIGFYGLLIYRRVNKPKAVDTSNMDHALALHKKDKLECEVDRQKNLFEYVDKSIRALNEHTCSVTGWGEESELCKSPLKEGIKNVLNDLVTNTNHVLSCTKSKFSVTMQIRNSPRKTSTGCCIDLVPETMHFRDNLNIDEILDRSIAGGSNLSGIELRFKQQSERSFNDSVLVVEEYEFGGTQCKLITSPVPAVCEGDNIGIIYIACEAAVPIIPADVFNTLKIFGRLSANWVSKYHSCMASDIMTALLEMKEEGDLPESFHFTEADIFNGLELPAGVQMRGVNVPGPLRNADGSRWIPPEAREAMARRAEQQDTTQPTE